MDEFAHIDFLELKAIEIDIRAYCKNRNLEHEYWNLKIGTWNNYEYYQKYYDKEITK